MQKLVKIAVSATLMTLAACGSQAEQSTPTNAADDFAARINGAKETPAPEPTGTVAPTVAEPLEGAAQGPYVAGTAPDPASATCGANEMGQFIGLEADDNVQLAIVNVIDGANEVRFIAAGSDYIRPDPTNPRLNIMLDAANIIRDARCG